MDLASELFVVASACSFVCLVWLAKLDGEIQSLPSIVPGKDSAPVIAPSDFIKKN